MPKISAPTVAEHRNAQHAALLTAAQEILLADGVDAVTPSAVTSRAGLARSTFYEYFPSKDDLLVGLARVAFERWGRELDTAIAPEAPGAPRLRAYVYTTLKMAADGQHALANALRGVPLSPRSHEHIADLHTALNEPLRLALGGLIDADDRLTPPLVHGLLGAAMSMITAGKDVAQVADQATRMILGGIARPA